MVASRVTDSMPDMSSSISNDYLFAGALHCNQHKDGYRFSIDPVLLAHYCTVKKRCAIVDLGAGCGVVGLILAHRYPDCHVTSVELQKPLSSLLSTNIKANNFSARMTQVQGDVRQIRTLLPVESADLVVCNPPYGVVTDGTLSLGSEQVIARHEICGTLQDFIAAASYLLKNRGRVSFILPSSRLPELMAGFIQHKLQPKRMQMIHSYPGGVGRLVLLEGIKNAGSELLVDEPLFVYTKKNGGYSPEVERMFV